MGFVVPIKSPNRQAVQSRVPRKCNVISGDIMLNSKLKITMFQKVKIYLNICINIFVFS